MGSGNTTVVNTTRTEERIGYPPKNFSHLQFAHCIPEFSATVIISTAFMRLGLHHSTTHGRGDQEAGPSFRLPPRELQAVHGSQ